MLLSLCSHLCAHLCMCELVETALTNHRIQWQHGNRINSEGEFVITSTRTRTQKQNFEDVLEKLQQVRAADECLKRVAKAGQPCTHPGFGATPLTGPNPYGDSLSQRLRTCPRKRRLSRSRSSTSCMLRWRCACAGVASRMHASTLDYGRKRIHIIWLRAYCRKRKQNERRLQEKKLHKDKKSGRRGDW